MSAKLESISPINGEVVWSGQAADQEQVADAMEAAAAALPAWVGLPVDRRMEIVRAYGQYLQENRTTLASLITQEVGKLPWDAHAEVSAAIAKVELSISALQQRRATHVVSEGAEAEPSGNRTVRVVRRVRHQPLGVALVLGPFNFPLHLPGGQIIPALLAGNTVVFKPSDQATAIGHWMHQAWRHAGLPDGVLQLLPGQVQTAVAAIDSPQVSGVFLTGSREAGRAIHRQLAGRFDVVLALELGGNNPIVVDGDASVQDVASVVSFAAFVSSGQRCTCARRALFIQNADSESQIDALCRRTNQLRVAMPGSQPEPHLGPLISAQAAAHLRETYDKLLHLGCQPLVPFQVDADHANLVRPCILDASQLATAALKEVGEHEWFGPILVIQRVPSFEAAVEAANRTPYGLAASLLGGTAEMFDAFAEKIKAGVVNWNAPTTGAAGTMPFGGLGDSGNHRPAGFYAIDFCCDPVASIERERLAQNDPWEVTQGS
ncbi:MAG: aldehyde dehydrogenase family protein [Planctomycetes bacterium]|nr:aldehyde dehydrogenase family protein [Planctomycetota bacterium]